MVLLIAFNPSLFHNENSQIHTHTGYSKRSIQRYDCRGYRVFVESCHVAWLVGYIDKTDIDQTQKHILKGFEISQPRINE